jgi:GDP-4-dehydro-6-deoxy-D-mannose reductase
VGRHLIAALRDQAGDAVVRATALRSADAMASGSFDPLDVRDEAAVAAAIAEFKPSHVVHLAGLSTLAAAAADVRATWQVHLFGALNVAQAILHEVPECTLLLVGSGEVYGASAVSGRPLDESAVLAPLSDYAASKAAADLAIGAMVRKGLRAVRLRPFNHTGPGQSDRFVVPSFARQIAAIEAGTSAPIIKVGNLDAERDFLDVRDVVRAYIAAIERSDLLRSGTILNLASGIPVKIGELLDRLLALSSTRITIEQDPARMRPNDIPRYIGDASRARELLDWMPRFRLEETLQAVLMSARYTARPVGME